MGLIRVIKEIASWISGVKLDEAIHSVIFLVAPIIMRSKIKNNQNSIKK